MRKQGSQKILNSLAFTLVEMMIVLGIIAGLMSFGVSVIGTTGNDMRDNSKNLVRIIKYIYNLAAVSSDYYRLVIDLDEQKYFVQVSPEPFFVVKEGDEVEAMRIKNQMKDDDGELGNDEEEAQKQQANQVGAFVESEDELLEIFEVPKTIKIKSVYVMHQLENIEEGKAYIYFFPKGLTEFSVIQITDSEEESFLTLIVNPLTGRTEVKEEEVDYEDLLRSYGQS